MKFEQEDVQENKSETCLTKRMNAQEDSRFVSDQPVVQVEAFDQEKKLAQNEVLKNLAKAMIQLLKKGSLDFDEELELDVLKEKYEKLCSETSDSVFVS